MVLFVCVHDHNWILSQFTYTYLLKSDKQLETKKKGAEKVFSFR